jgi:hypothetical protein
MSISRFLSVLLLAALGVSCKSDPMAVTSERSRLGDIKVDVDATYRATDGIVEMEFRGRVSFPLEPRDSLYVIPNKGTFKRRIVLKDTLSPQRDSVSIFYTLPTGLAVRVDPTMTLVMVFKRTATGLAFLLKTKSDSLVCLIGNLSGAELDLVQSRTGAQNFRVIVGQNAYVTRNTECGRESDNNTVFTFNDGMADVPPAKSAGLQSGAYAYAMFNVVNTQIVKNVQNCTNYVGELAYIIMRQ